MRKAPGLLLSLVMALSLSAQQVADTSYRFHNPNPAFPAGTGPTVCVDEAHFNFHTPEGRYKPFADLLRSDGYQVKSLTVTVSHKVLVGCQILVIANAVSESDSTASGPFRPYPPPYPPSYPHPSAFAREEISELLGWVRNGGSLLLIGDHPPSPGAASHLALLLGVHMLDGFAWSSAETPRDVIIFGTADEKIWRRFAEEEKLSNEQLHRILTDTGSLGRHPILKGRNRQEQVGSVVTFLGHPFYPSPQVEPLLILGPSAIGSIPIAVNLESAKPEAGPQFAVGGWLQGAALRLGRGRAVILGEAAMCSAQVQGPNRRPFGMNAPIAANNAQFCLNVVRWLSGLLDH